MARLIDADKLKNHYAWWKGGSREMTMDEAKADFDVIVDLQPEVKLEQKVGKWEKAPETQETLELICTYDGYRCTYCGNIERMPSNYCPRCGAKMW